MKAGSGTLPLLCNNQLTLCGLVYRMATNTDATIYSSASMCRSALYCPLMCWALNSQQRYGQKNWKQWGAPFCWSCQRLSPVWNQGRHWAIFNKIHIVCGNQTHKLHVTSTSTASPHFCMSRRVQTLAREFLFFRNVVDLFPHSW